MFLHLMQICIRELNFATCRVYLDDVVIFSVTEEEWFRTHSLKVKPSKHFLSPEDKVYQTLSVQRRDMA